MDNITRAPTGSDGVTFTINTGVKERQCSISREALMTLSQLKNIDSSDADTLELFKAFEAFIRPVAQSLIGGKVATTPLQLTPENITNAYRGTVKFQPQ